MNPQNLHKFLDYVPRGALTRNAYKLVRPKRYEIVEKSRAQLSSEEPNIAPFFQSKTLFIHIPKTAGISVVLSLYGREIRMSHTRLGVFRLLLTEKEFDSFFKFAFVRHPTDRFISAYHFLKKGGITPMDRAFAEKTLSAYDNISDFARRWLTPESIYEYTHFIPQHDYVTIRGDIATDYIGRFENINEDYDFIRNKSGIGEPLKKYNAQGQSAKRNELEPDVRRLIENAYEKDFTLFNYEP